MSPPQHSKRAEDKFIGTCSSGAQWYACPDGSKSRFVGCCAKDPCSTGCAQGSIKPVAFDVGMNFTFPDASCGTGSAFYSCTGGKTFWGCCKLDPCAHEQECPTGDLTPAFMDLNEQFLAYVGESNTTSAATTTGVANPSATGRPQPTHTVAIIAGVVAGVLGLAIIVSIVVCVLCRRKRSDRKNDNVETHGGFPSETTPMTEKNINDESSVADIPPMYTSPNPNTHPTSPAFRPQYKQDMLDVQELPAEVLLGPSSLNSPNFNRSSELPASTSFSPKNSTNPNKYSELPTNMASTSQSALSSHRLSELPAEGAWMAELESPAPSLRPQPAAFGQESAKNVAGSNEVVQGTLYLEGNKVT